MKTKTITFVATLFLSLNLFAQEADKIYFHFTDEDGNDSVVSHTLSEVDSLSFGTVNTVTIKVEAESTADLKTKDGGFFGAGELYVIFWTNSSEVVSASYSVDVPVAGTYDFSLKLKNFNEETPIELEVNGVFQGSINVPNSGGQIIYEEFKGIDLDLGTNAIKFTVSPADGQTGFSMPFESFTLTKQ